MNISITQALNELKLLDARIDRTTNQSTFCVSYMNGTKINGTLTVNEAETNIKGSHQSIKDLISRRAEIKSKIVASNALTEVKVGDVTMTVAEAIERKNSIVYDQNLLDKLKSDYAQAQKVLLKGNEVAREKAQASLDTVLGKENSKSASEQDIASVYDPVFQRYEYKMIDPILIAKEIEKLETYIEDFVNNVDFVLSTSNAITTINID